MPSAILFSFLFPPGHHDANSARFSSTLLCSRSDIICDLYSRMVSSVMYLQLYAYMWVEQYITRWCLWWLHIYIHMCIITTKLKTRSVIPPRCGVVSSFLPASEINLPTGEGNRCVLHIPKNLNYKFGKHSLSFTIFVNFFLTHLLFPFSYHEVCVVWNR